MKIDKEMCYLWGWVCEYPVYVYGMCNADLAHSIFARRLWGHLPWSRVNKIGKSGYKPLYHIMSLRNRLENSAQT